MIEFVTAHWLLLLAAAGLAGLLLRWKMRSRARRHELEERATRWRLQREREEREEEERRLKAAEAARGRICTSEEELQQALGGHLPEIVLEGKLANGYRNDPGGLQRLGEGGYRVALARHGKLVLRQAEASGASGASDVSGLPSPAKEPSMSHPSASGLS